MKVKDRVDWNRHGPFVCLAGGILTILFVCSH
ncbi:hypothetical protein GTHT12_02681 [Geobacillus thermodenitrificans]|nr:hypothetical protein GTHT12_02681 [Geobacillus thermodenitrificans]